MPFSQYKDAMTQKLRYVNPRYKDDCLHPETGIDVMTLVFTEYFTGDKQPRGPVEIYRRHNLHKSDRKEYYKHSEGYMSNGKRVGEHKFYDRKKRLVKSAYYKDDKKDGWTKKFYSALETGHKKFLKSDILFANGVKILSYDYDQKQQLQAVTLHHANISEKSRNNINRKIRAQIALLNFSSNVSDVFDKRSIAEQNHEKITKITNRYPHYIKRPDNIPA